MTDINLDDLAKHFNVTIGTKKPEDPKDAELRRFKDKNLFLATLIAFAIMYIVCIAFMVTQPTSPYIGTALNGVIGLTLALAGYYVRGRTH